jgi:uncharacterized protein (TIGR03083 family)
MTPQAMRGWTTVRFQLDEILNNLSDADWLAPSACPGWLVRDVVAHLAANARAPIEPLPEIRPAPPLPDNRERLHDLVVARRRAWPIAEILHEYHTYVPKLVDFVASMQDQPAAEKPFSVPGLGIYPAHSLANAQVFDYYCHMRHDLLRPRGPLYWVLPPPDHDTVYSAVVWMMLGLPQMQGSELDETVRAPVTFRLTGAGASEWTVHRGDPSGALTVEETGGADVVVTSDADAFIAWGTQRRRWRTDCTIEGDESLAVPLLDALNIV